MLRRLLLVSVLSIALFALLSIAGCGGSTGPTTRAGLIAKADTICRRVNAKRITTSAKIKGQGDIARQIPSLATYEHAAFAELKRLIPPASMAGPWRQMVTAAQMLAADTNTLGEYAGAGRFRAVYRRILPAVDRDAMRMDTIARDQGFADCAHTI